MNDSKILIVDDDPDIIEFLSYNLKSEGFNTETLQNPLLVIDKVQTFKPDLMILDIMMPKLDGIELCELIRNTKGIDQTLITFLTARSEDYSQIAGYNAGADDYITKPIRPKLLISKINALLKRKESGLNSKGLKPTESPQKITDITIDKERYLIIKDNKEYILPKKEFELLSLLASQPNKVFHRAEIYTKVWGEDSFVGDRTIDVHIRKLRKKFGDDIIRTVKGIGYKFKE